MVALTPPPLKFILTTCLIALFFIKYFQFRSAVNDLAPLFHQLLKLISNDSTCSAKLINCITQYFISKLDFADRQGDGMESSDLIQSDHSSEEVQQTEAIIVYYIAQVENSS